MKDKEKHINEILDGKHHTVKEVSEILGVSRYTVFRWFNMGVLSHFSLSERCTIVTHTELKRFLNERLDLLSKQHKQS